MSALEEDKKGQIDWSKIGFQVAICSVSHPVTQARHLIQLGHEPAAPFQKEAGFLKVFSPGGQFHNGVFTGYLLDAGLLSREVIYAGLVAKMTETCVSSISQTLIEPVVDDLFLNKTYEKTKTFDDVLAKSLKQFSIQATGIICSRPFCVIAIRQIASIADGTNESSLIEGVKQIASENAWFTGLVPRLLHEAITVFGLNTLVFLYEQTLKDKADDVVEKTMPLLLSLAVSSVAYPLHLVSNIQCIQGTKSVLNAHPELTWLNILSKLYSAKDHSRGSSIFFSRKVRAIKSQESAV